MTRMMRLGGVPACARSWPVRKPQGCLVAHPLGNELAARDNEQTVCPQPQGFDRIARIQHNQRGLPPDLQAMILKAEYTGIVYLSHPGR